MENNFSSSFQAEPKGQSSADLEYPGFGVNGLALKPHPSLQPWQQRGSIKGVGFIFGHQH